MLGILTARPSVGAHKVDPLSVDEIDAQPNADRVWATIKQVRNFAYEAEERAKLEAFEEINEAEEYAAKSEREGCRGSIEGAVASILNNEEGKSREWLISEVEKLADVL